MRSAVNDLLGAYDKLIMDPVHGGIPLYRHEIKVIDHPLFQRLRNICQNDILSLVFPGATHWRDARRYTDVPLHDRRLPAGTPAQRPDRP